MNTICENLKIMLNIYENMTEQKKTRKKTSIFVKTCLYISLQSQFGSPALLVTSFLAQVLGHAISVKNGFHVESEEKWNKHLINKVP